MDKISARYKAKNKKAAPNAKPKTAKKRKSDGPTCSMFLSELTRKFALKKRQEAEAPLNVVQSIIDSIANALPIKFSKKLPPKSASPMKIETLQTYAPELLPNDILNFPQTTKTSHDNITDEDISINEVEIPKKLGNFRMPKMPVINSEVLKLAAEKKRKEQMQDESVNTAPEHDVASEIAKHVTTLKKISLIAEEFNQKTAKNLKEIVDSVQQDLIKKLEEIQAEQKAEKLAAKPQILDQGAVLEEKNIFAVSN